MPIAKAVVVPENLKIAENRRLVTPSEAQEMKENPGAWYAVETKTAGRAAIRQTASRLRSLLPEHYGGEWESRHVDGVVYVRFMGEAAA